jgi:DNA polymerase-3 subunit alpha
MHAGGVLIAPGKLTDFTPLYCAEGSTAMVSQFDKDDVEKAGLVKFDFLGLTTLTILDWATRNVHALGDKDFRLESIPLDDAPTYQLLSRGNSTAVFQLESRGMRDLIKRLKPDRFEDVIALVALYRPARWTSSRTSSSASTAASASSIRIRACNRSSDRPTGSWCTRSR